MEEVQDTYQATCLFEEAATLPCAAVTAWVVLTGHRRVTAGDTPDVARTAILRCTTFPSLVFSESAR